MYIDHIHQFIYEYNLSHNNALILKNKTEISESVFETLRNVKIDGIFFQGNVSISLDIRGNISFKDNIVTNIFKNNVQSDLISFLNIKNFINIPPYASIDDLEVDYVNNLKKDVKHKFMFFESDNKHNFVSVNRICRLDDCKLSIERVTQNKIKIMIQQDSLA
jgi:hypothetical protein